MQIGNEKLACIYGSSFFDLTPLGDQLKTVDGVTHQARSQVEPKLSF